MPEIHPKEIAAHSFRDYLVRFGFGAGISLVAGLIGLKFGPVVGGVFLGFPAILPASLTLIQKKEGRRQASIDSEGAVLGAIAMVAFAIAVWMWVTHLGVELMLLVGLVGWVVLAVALYTIVIATLHREPSPR